MSGLIERQAAIDLIQHAGKIGKLTCIDILKDLPDADAVKVVRCKDCKHSDAYNHCTRLSIWNKPEDFCSYAERKEE